METVREPIVKIEYESKDITKYIEPYLMSITYTDYEHGQSDEIEIVLDDSEALWQSSWYPTKGDRIKAQIGYKGERLLNCGVFEIDEPELSFAPDVFTIRGLATSIKKPLRQKNTVAYENKTLVDIANIIGKKHGFKVAGSEGFISVGRVTQKQETDLEFLKRIAEKYGYLFKITDNVLVFMKTETLESKKSLFIIKKSDLSGGTLRDKSCGIYSACTVQYFDPKTKRLHSTTVHSNKVVNGDTLKITERCEGKTQAQLKAKAALANNNGRQVEGNLIIEGNVDAIAGINFELQEAKKFNGIYHVTESRHTIIPSEPYKCDLTIKRVA